MNGRPFSPARVDWPRPALALRESLREGYGFAGLRADLMAGMVVGVVALPLSMALAIASGVPPQHGLYTAIVGGGLIALLGGSRVQVSGPTAAFVVILSPISHHFGLGGLLLATLMAGVLLIAMGLARMGRLIEFVPYPVTTGFTAGIAVVIGTLQIKDLLGLTVEATPEHYLERLEALALALPTTRLEDVVIGSLTLALLIFWPRVTPRIPGPLVALTLGAGAAALAAHLIPGFEVATIQSRFHYVLEGATLPGIPRTPPLPVLPWNMPGPDGRPLLFSFTLIRLLAPSAFAIALLGAMESLLSAVVADGMTGQKHDPDVELVAQGLGNLVVPFFGGVAATGAIARTATNVRSGARSPLAAFFHSLVLLAAVLALAPLLGYLPMASLAALLLLVAWNMSERDHFVRMLRVAPRSDVAVLLICFGLTVIFDMVVAVTVGVVLASLLFMKRMAEVSEVRLVQEHPLTLEKPLPKGVLIYEVAGPLFFGAAHQAMAALKQVDAGVRVVILDLRSVPVMDATALVGLESAFERLHRGQIFVMLAGVQAQPLRVMARAGWRDRHGRLAIYRTFERAVDEARKAFE
ncbi:MAG TPA: C4-dicarboxylic acid transporter DauA [Vicinamibacteria bacterium]|nr:C4-dicarboxylic acid transporter DauA [Vicinamibacteria bacterium]